jgi:RNA polymerase sigma-70 factor (ECF subfamily)
MSQPAESPSGPDRRLALASFYDRAVDEVYRYFSRATAGDRRTSEDLTQETFLACLRAVDDGHPDALTMPWLIGVARHKLIDHYRRTTRDERKLSLAWSSTAAPPPAIEDLTDTEIMDALRGLSPEHRVVLVLRYLDDLPVADVAAAIGKSVGATESLLVRARRSLDRALTEGRDV